MKKNKLVEYDFEKPIHLLEQKRNGFDIMFYSGLLSVLCVILVALICVHDGKFEVKFVLWRVIVCIPVFILTTFVKQMLNEIRIYPKFLKEKHIWTLSELMKITGKDAKSTKEIMTRVLESCYNVDPKCIKK